MKSSPCLHSLLAAIAIAASGVVADDSAFAQPPGRNEALLNREFKATGPPSERGSWIWRHKKTIAPTDGFEAFEVFVKELPRRPGRSEITIRLYEGPGMTDEKLIRAEAYEKLVLEPRDEANSPGHINQTFHYLIKSPQRGPDGQSLNNGLERYFIITGTGVRNNSGGANRNRTFRLTTFLIKPSSSSPAEEQNGKQVKRTSFVPCIDYPDDAVLDEEPYSETSPVPDDPDEDDPWLIYSWP